MTLIELNEMLQAVKQRQSGLFLSRSTRKFKRHNENRANTKLNKTKSFRVIVDGVDKGLQVTGNYMSRSEARTHFSNKNPGKYVQIKVVKSVSKDG